jgi:hypothetical protein
MIVATQAEPEGDLVVTRWTVTAWRSSDGAHVVRTSAVFANAPAGRVSSDFDSPKPTVANSANSDAQVQRAQSRQILQPVSSYTAVAVPGGWLIFQL